MSMTNRILAAALLAGTAIALPASATTYVVTQTIGTGSVTGTITTNNALGVLSTANITGFNLTLNDGITTFNLTNTNGQVAIVGSALTATANGLFYNFSGASNSYALFQAPTLASSIDYFCLQVSGCYSPPVAGAGLRITGPLLNNAQTGNVQFATTSAVPETATWGMMIAGFGMMGAAMRTRRRSTKVTFA